MGLLKNVRQMCSFFFYKTLLVIVFYPGGVKPNKRLVHC